MAGRHAIAPQTGCPDQLDRLQGRGRLDVEAHPVALLDRGHGPLAVSPGERVQDREAGARPRRPGATARPARRRSARRRRSATAAGTRSVPGSRWAARSPFGADASARDIASPARGGAPQDDAERRPRRVHQAAGDDQRRVVAVLARPTTTVTAPSAVADAADQQHGDPQQVDEQHQPRAAPELASAEPAASAPRGTPPGRRRRASACSASSGGRLGGARPRCRPRRAARPRSTSERSARNASRSVRSSPANSAARCRRSASSRRTAVPLSTSAVGPDLQHLSPPMRLEPRALGPLGDLARPSLGGSARRRPRASEAPGSAPCPRAAGPAALERVRVELERRTRARPGPRSSTAGSRLGLARAGREQLEAVVAGVGRARRPRPARRASTARRPETQATSA